MKPSSFQVLITKYIKVIFSNLSLSDGNTVLTLNKDPLDFYEGSALLSFASEKNA
ncbi:MAG: hypothetical protein GXY48_07100 [Methanomicrobiales archaeon]|nr:hypothetical protein [Methanomicrobiales archaeon]